MEHNVAKAKRVFRADIFTILHGGGQKLSIGVGWLPGKRGVLKGFIDDG